VTRSWLAASAIGCAALAGSAAPAIARQSDGDDIGIEDIATAPLRDLNLRRDRIPAALLRARLAPYADVGMDNCAGIKQEIGNLDAVLGEDMDTAMPDGGGGLAPGKAARDVLTSLIPYRGVIRELSGANDHEQAFRQAIAAGLMRRAYLKGLGQAKNCPYPARPSLSGIYIVPPEEMPPLYDPVEQTGGEPVFISEPVVEPIPNE